MLQVKTKGAIKTIWEAGVVMMCMFREEIMYTDIRGATWRHEKREGYFSYTDFIRKLYPNYTVDEKTHLIMPDTSARSVDFNTLWKILRSTDRELMEGEENKWMFDGEVRFLDNKQNLDDLGQRVGMSSYMRSGNAFLRKTLQSITKIATGCVGSLNTGTMSQIVGLVGQCHTDDHVWVCKSHHPFTQLNSTTYNGNKAVCVMRNPLDSIVSFGVFLNTMAHASAAEYDFTSGEHKEWWDWWVKAEIDRHARFWEVNYQDWVTDRKVPVHIIRYEDLVDKPQETLEGLLAFMLELEDIEGTNVQELIR